MGGFHLPVIGIIFKFIFIHLNGGFLNQLYFCNFLEENYHPFSELCIPVVPRCHLNFFTCSDWCSTKREHREHIICQVVTCERLKAKLSDQRVVVVTYKRWLFTQGSYYRPLSGKI